MLKDHLAIQGTMHASNVVNKDTLPETALKGSNAVTTMPTSSILMTMTRNTTTITPRNNRPTLLTISKLDSLISLETIKLNWQKKWV